VNNNPNFAFRIVAEFGPSRQYEAARTSPPTCEHAGAGRWAGGSGRAAPPREEVSRGARWRALASPLPALQARGISFKVYMLWNARLFVAPTGLVATDAVGERVDALAALGCVQACERT
jgi:hypothetical protein